MGHGRPASAHRTWRRQRRIADATGRQPRRRPSCPGPPSARTCLVTITLRAGRAGRRWWPSSGRRPGRGGLRPADRPRRWCRWSSAGASPARPGLLAGPLGPRAAGRGDPQPGGAGPPPVGGAAGPPDAARHSRLRAGPGVPGRHRADGRRLLRRLPARRPPGWPRSSATSPGTGSRRRSPPSRPSTCCGCSCASTATRPRRVEQLNAQMSASERIEEFISLCVVVFDTEAGTLRYASAGHPAGLAVARPATCGRCGPPARC